MKCTRSLTLTTVGAAIFASTAFPASAAPPQYSVTVIGSFEAPGYGRYSTPLAINNLGDVVGRSSIPAGSAPFVYTDGVLSRLNVPPDNTPVASAQGINDAGLVVGSFDLPYGAFLWSAGLFTDLGTLGGSTVSASAINNHNRVVGSSKLAGDLTTAAFSWESGLMTALSTPSAMTDAAAFDISDTGFIAGYGYRNDVVRSARPVLWRDGVPEVLPVFDEDGNSYAKAVNNLGQAVGHGRPYDGRMRALLWRDGHVIDLGDFGGSLDYTEAIDINDLGQIIGVASDGWDDAVPFLWQDGVMYKLQDLLDPAFASTRLITAGYINNAGQIAVTADIDGAQTAVLLTPIPAPAAFTLLFTGLAITHHRRSARSR